MLLIPYSLKMGSGSKTEVQHCSGVRTMFSNLHSKMNSVQFGEMSLMSRS